MISLSIDNSTLPLYQQVYLEFKNEIIQGKIKSKSKLPSKRKLAGDLNISVNTIDTAYGQLVAEGYIESRPKSGYFVCDFDGFILDQSEPVVNTHNNSVINQIVVDFSPGDIDYNAFPFNKFNKILKNSFNEYDKSSLSRMDQGGDISFREDLSKFLAMSRGVKSTAEQIIIGAGTDNLLLILSMIFNKHSKIAMENPLYNKAYRIFQSMGHNLVTIDIDDKGIPIQPLNQHKAEIVYITPSHQFPLGISMPISRRIMLLNWAMDQDERYIIEDDYDSEFRYNSKPIPALQSIDQHDKVIYIGTFSKSIAPSMRISYMVLPKPLLARFKHDYSFIGSSSSRIEQNLLGEFIRDGQYETHLNKMRKIYKDKRIHLIKEMTNLGNVMDVIGENAGHHILARVNCGLSEDELVKKAYDFGVRVYPISKFFIGQVPDKYRSTVLLGYGALTADEISEGIRLLGQAWEIG